MENYSFWKEFFDAYRSSSDLIKALCIVVPPSALLGMTWIVLNAPFFQPRTGRSPETPAVLRLPSSLD